MAAALAMVGLSSSQSLVLVVTWGGGGGADHGWWLGCLSLSLFLATDVTATQLQSTTFCPSLLSLCHIDWLQQLSASAVQLVQDSLSSLTSLFQLEHAALTTLLPLVAPHTYNPL